MDDDVKAPNERPSYWLEACEDISCDDLIHDFEDFGSASSLATPLVPEPTSALSLLEGHASLDPSFFGGIDRILDSIKYGGESDCGTNGFDQNEDATSMSNGLRHKNKNVKSDVSMQLPDATDENIARHIKSEVQHQSKFRYDDNDRDCHGKNCGNGKRARLGDYCNEKKGWQRSGTRKRPYEGDDNYQRDRVRRKEERRRGIRKDLDLREVRGYWERDKDNNEMVFRLGSWEAGRNREGNVASTRSSQSDADIQNKVEGPKEKLKLPEEQARQYQLEVLEQAKKKNTIAFLETGAGKTLIAVLLIKGVCLDMQKDNKKMLAVFLVPKVPLVYQQAEVIRESTGYQVGHYCGEMGQDFWDARRWHREFETKQVLVMTAQILLNILRHSIIKMEAVNLLILDECHHAVKKHPYSLVMSEFYHTTPKERRPSVFGMTASPVNLKGVRRTGRKKVDRNAIKEFTNWIKDMDMVNIPSRGFDFTWSNNRDDDERVYTKIDHMFCNEKWKSLVPHCQLDYGAPITSDHSPGILSMELGQNFGPKPFKFIKGWMKHPTYKYILKKSWEAPVEGNNQKAFCLKLRRLKDPLKKLNRNQFGGITDRVKGAKVKLEESQLALVKDPTNIQLQIASKNALLDYTNLLAFEESFFKEKARVKWMSEGDRNTRFFHRSVQSHMARNKILRLQNEEGVMIEDYDVIKMMAPGFFENLFKEPSPGKQPTQTWKGNTLTNDQNLSLVLAVSRPEIKDAIFSMKGDSAPGPDGFTIEFYQDNWSTVGEELLDAVELFFTKDFIYYPMNATTISLIPKVDNPIQMKDFRPISCCNVIYKIISKVMANRMKPLLPHLVDQNQGAFVKGRNIQENIMLMHDMVKNYQRQGGPTCCAIKIDIMKAFDTVNWNYLMHILEKMNFPDKFRNWIWLCISTASFSVNLNGSLVGHFNSSRGLRQGDPLSPCLFILVMEGFTQLLKGKISNSSFKFHPRCEQTNLSSLAFADDLFILANADLESIRVVKDALTEFEDLSGLQPNLQKCEIFTSGITSRKKQQVADILGMKLGTLPIRYLGIPLVQGKLSYTHCGPLLDKLNHRVQSWSSSKLSYGGRLQLINAVLMAICRYWTSSMFLPRKIVREIEKILKQFLWGGTRKAKIKWDTLCLPKTSGGLGIFDLTLTNDAYIMKNLWNICENKESLWVKWVHSVILKGKSIWEAKIRQNDSWLWKRMLRTRDKFSQCINRRIGNGEKTSFWNDPWHPWGILGTNFPELRRKLHINDEATVARIICGSQWRIPFGRGWDAQIIAFNQACCSIPIRGGDDTWSWTPNPSFSLKNAIAALQPNLPAVEWHKIVWCNRHLPRYAIILWLACWKRMVTQDKLLSWGLLNTNKCVLCDRFQEDHDHLFFQCPYASKVWGAVLNQLKCKNVTNNWHGVINWLLSCSNWTSKFQMEISYFGFAATVYGIWRERNQRLFQKVGRDEDSLKRQILENICFYASSWKRIKKTKRSWELAINLGIPMKIFK